MRLASYRLTANVTMTASGASLLPRDRASLHATEKPDAELHSCSLCGGRQKEPQAGSWRLSGAFLTQLNPSRPCPSLPACSLPFLSPGAVPFLFVPGRPHGLRDERLLPRGRSSTLWPKEARAALGNAGILDLPLKPIFSRPHAVPAAGRRHPQPAFCSRPLSSPGYWSSSSLSSPCCCSRPPCWPPPCCRGWRSRASASRRRSCGASGAARPKFFAPAARRDGRRGPSRGTPHEAHGPTCGVVWGVFGGSTSGAEKNFMTFFFFPVNR